MKLTPYLWPKENPRLKLRIAGALSVLLLGKWMNVQVPYIFKRIIDKTEQPAAGSVVDNAEVQVSRDEAPLSAIFQDIFVSESSLAYFSNSMQVVGYLCLAYLLARGSAASFNELRNVIFSKVTETCNRFLTLETLDGLSKMNLEFYKAFPIAVITKTVDRANRGIRFLVASILLNLAPTVFEVTYNFLFDDLYLCFIGWSSNGDHVHVLWLAVRVSDHSYS